ncbi:MULTISPECIES: hypothetical protein [unclassified Bradyrhizobium]|uniref:hypothetical protein n=1 Tax=unclassified Bradyrhizobium TaxID=2631580 RepID=UPI0012EC1A9A|nr:MULTISPECIES: hypothetical protein [unclassified Bradyrhizobium]QIG91231.1 hypothetical protein G6P99_01005 [Bradyrhizobium sp. 6(2017)]
MENQDAGGGHHKESNPPVDRPGFASARRQPRNTAMGHSDDHRKMTKLTKPANGFVNRTP